MCAEKQKVRWKRLTLVLWWNSTTEEEWQSKFVRVFAGTETQRKEYRKRGRTKKQGEGFRKKEGAIFMLCRCRFALWGSLETRVLNIIITHPN